MIAAIILAAGQSSRFGRENKLTATWNEKPMVRNVFDAAVAGQFDTVVVVTGHEAGPVGQSLPSNANIVHNADFSSGMSSSIRAGISYLPEEAAVMILLGDMPLVTTSTLDLMINAYKGVKSRHAIVVATNGGVTGNPVLFGPAYIPDLLKLHGDRGARGLIDANRSELIKIEAGEAAMRDFDTRSSLEN